MSQKVSVVVCTTGRETLKECLKSLKNQSYENHEVIVVGIDERSRSFASEFGFNFFFSPKANSSFQRNLGIEESEGDIVAFIDDDAVADKDWLRFLAMHYKDDRVACVGGRIILKFLSEVPAFLKELPDEIFKGFLGGTLLNSRRAVKLQEPLLWGTNLSFKKDVFDEVGFFDLKLGRTPDRLISEDETELQRRIMERGYGLIYEPRAIVTHLIGEERLTKEWFLERSFWQGYSEILRIRNREDFKILWKKKGFQAEFLEYLCSLESMETLFELFGTDDLKKKIDVSRKLGRIKAFSDLLKG